MTTKKKARARVWRRWALVNDRVLHLHDSYSDSIYKDRSSAIQWRFGSDLIRVEIREVIRKPRKPKGK